MLRVHIVEKYHSFAMQRHTRPLMKLIDVEMTMSEEVDETADVNIHMPFHFLTNYTPTGESKHIMCFTHVNPLAGESVYVASLKADAVTALSFEGRKLLVDMGVDPRKIHVTYCGVDHVKFRRKNIGMVASKQPHGRKRAHLLLDLAWKMPPELLGLFQFILIGPGFDSLVEELREVGVAIEYIEKIVEEDNLMSYYHLFDVLLSTGYV